MNTTITWCLFLVVTVAQGPGPLTKRTQLEPHWIIAPDIVFSMPEAIQISANKEVINQQWVIPTHFSMDRWVQAVQIRPSDPRVVHHAVLYVRPPGAALGDLKTEVLAIYTAGAPAMICPSKMAKRIPAGADLVLETHYVALDTDAQDQTDIGLTMLNGDPDSRVLTLQMGRDNIVIPAGDHDYRVAVTGVMPRDAVLLAMFPLLHRCGVEFEYTVPPKTLLDAKPFEARNYALVAPLPLRRGERIAWIAHFDNPATTQVSGEVMNGYFDVAVPPDVDKARFFTGR